MKLSRMSYSPIGLDVGSKAIKAVQLVRSGRDAAVHAAARIPRGQRVTDLTPEELLRAVGVLRRQGFVGRRAVASVPPAVMLSGVLELPAQSGKTLIPLDVIARQELARTAKREPQSIELGWWDLPSASRSGTSQGTQGMAIGCAHDVAEALLDRLELEGPGGSTGFDVIALDAPPTALARACVFLAAPAPELTAVLDLGWNCTQLLIIAGDTPVYERTIADSGARLLVAALANRVGATDELAEHLLRTVGCRSEVAQDSPEGDLAAASGDARAMICSHADALAAELRTSIAYTSRRFDAGLTRALLTGGVAEMPGLAERLAERAGVEVKVARVDALCPAAEGLDPSNLGPGAALALGLALHPTGGGA